MDYENSSPINIDTASHQHISICTQCPQLERKLDESQNELRQLTAKLDTLQKKKTLIREIDKLNIWRMKTVQYNFR